MNGDSSSQKTFEKARQLHAAGRLAEAETAYSEISRSTEHREAALQSLAQLYLQSQRPRDAVDTLAALNREMPDSLSHCARYAGLLDALGETGAAIAVYDRFVLRQPNEATAQFNLALLYKKEKRFDEARSAYEKAIGLGIRNPQETYSNLGVLYAELRDPENATTMYRRALEIAPDYLPALFNLAGLLEELGEREEAIEYFEKILAIEPRHHESRARVIHATRITSEQGALLTDLQQAIKGAGNDRFGLETLHFAVGKAMDDMGRYDEAFGAYKTANELARSRMPPYDRVATEQAFNELIELFDADWIENARSSSTFAPVFICGLFRSGSTLTEQLLGRHPDVTVGGELDLLPWLLERRFVSYPKGAANAPRDLIQAVADEYQSKVLELLPGGSTVTDKRPDNFLHLGLIKAMFPSARIVLTKRNPMDNCLSIYFQQLGGALSYSTNLEDTAHYFKQHERLMAHWQSCIGDDIHTVVYEDLVREPEPVLRRLLDFLGLDWDDRCLDFTQAGNLVKTASVWQVREELHSKSAGRWQNYAPQLGHIPQQFETDTG
jgi:tetratricopeptide (TPR) repeat protein